MKQTLIIIAILIIALVALQWLKKTNWSWLSTTRPEPSKTGAGQGQKGTGAGTMPGVEQGLPGWFYGT